MSYYKKIIYLILFSALVLYISIGLIFYIKYAQTKIKFIGHISTILSPISGILNDKGVSKLYYLNPKVFSNDKSTFTLDFSKNDIKYKDSIINEIKSS